LPAFQQYLELPRAIANSDGQPVKGIKANTMKVYEKPIRMGMSPNTNSSLPPSWNPDTVIINITSWSAHKNIGQYEDSLLRQHVLLQCHNRSSLAFR
jgi:hypothetical protein